MIKWYCFRHEKHPNNTDELPNVGGSSFKDYIPTVFHNSILATTGASEWSPGVGFLNLGVRVSYGINKRIKTTFIKFENYAAVRFETPREAFEAAEKAFASNYPELYLRAVMNEGGRSRD